MTRLAVCERVACTRRRISESRRPMRAPPARPQRALRRRPLGTNRPACHLPVLRAFDPLHELVARLGAVRPELGLEAGAPISSPRSHSHKSSRPQVCPCTCTTAGACDFLTGGFESPAVLQCRPQSSEGAVERHLDRVRLRALELGDLPRCEICAVAKRDQLAIPLLEPADCAVDSSIRRIVSPSRSTDRSTCRALRRELERLGSPFDAAACDPDQPTRQALPCGSRSSFCSEALARRSRSSCPRRPGPSPTRYATYA